VWRQAFTFIQIGSITTPSAGESKFAFNLGCPPTAKYIQAIHQALYLEER
jgi:hypothetical protein